MADGIAALSSLTGLPRAEVESLAAQVKANHARLNDCAWHEFHPIAGRDRLRKRYRCARCGGEVDSHAYYWHEQGRRPAPVT